MLLIFYRNELTRCSEIQEPNLNVWKDETCLAKNTDHLYVHEQQNWNENAHTGYNPFTYQRSHISNRNRLVTPWSDVNQPSYNNFYMSDVYRQINRKNFPSMPVEKSDNVPIGDQMELMLNTKTRADKNVYNYDSNYKRPKFEDKINSEQRPVIYEHFKVTEPLHESKEKIKDVETQESENIALKAKNNTDTNRNVKMIFKSMNIAQSNFLQRISNIGQPGFEELGFFTVLTKY